jgi:hypothetical protein
MERHREGRGWKRFGYDLVSNLYLDSDDGLFIWRFRVRFG